MKLPTSCMQCLVEGRQPNIRSLESVAVPNDGVIRMTCDLGHQTHVILQEERFELLSQLAIAAIADGYYREAVASFTASLERLYEFYLRVVWRRGSVPEDVITRAWKLVSKSSERQFGAFVAAYLSEEQVAPVALTNRQVEFRNNVVHNGDFPTREEAVAYCQAVADVAAPIMSRLRAEIYDPHVREHMLVRLRAGHKNAHAKGARSSTAHHPTFFSMATAVENLDVQMAVKEYAKRPKFDGLTNAAALLMALLSETEGPSKST